MPRNFDHTELGPLMRQARPTLMSMLPAALFHLIREHDTVAEDFSSVRFCRCGGDKVPLELDAEFMALTGQPVREGYGMTETGIAANNPRGGADKFGSIGIPNPGFMFSIRDAGGREVAAGEEGRAYIGAPSLFSGYWNDPAATAEVLRDGWIDTGDVMRVDEDGYLWFAGRQKQIIVHDSSNIAPQEVEDAPRP
jgi:acyl-CoA synthetase (AMP-forming)/AMP-acid ligase II